MIEDNNSQRPHEAGLLTLDISKSLNQLGWSPTWNSDKALKRTAAWYRGFLNAENTKSLVDNDINLFISNESI